MKIVQILILVVVWLSVNINLMSAQAVVFEGINLLSMQNDQIEHDMTVIVTNGTINWVGPADEAVLLNDAEIISGQYYLMPGLAEMHAHIPSQQQGDEYALHVLKMYVSQGDYYDSGDVGSTIPFGPKRTDIEWGYYWAQNFHIRSLF